MKRMKALLLGVSLWSLLGAGPVTAAGLGELDASFGEDGRVATALNHFGDQAYAIAVQADGRILVGGSSSSSANLDFAVVRYTREGALDSSFNLDGTVTTMVGSEDDEIAALAVQNDGYIVAAGYSATENGRDFALVRYTPDGLLDHSFGLGGIVVTDYSVLDDELTALAVDSEGRLVAAGYTTGTSGRAVVVARYLPSGNLDLTFGDDGVNLIGVGEDAVARGIAVDKEGRVLVAGSYLFGSRSEVMVLRLTPEGELDSTFGEEGLAAIRMTDVSTDGFGIGLLDSGAILVAGAVGNPGTFDTALFGFTPDGRQDVSFGENGILVTEASQEDDMAQAVAVRGNIVGLSGYATVNGVREFLFIYHELDSPDRESVSFDLKGTGGTTGLRINERQVMDSYSEYQVEQAASTAYPLQTIVNTTSFGATDDISYAVAVQADGKAVAAGLTEQGGIKNFAVVRYATTSAATNSLAVSWIVTKEPSEVTRVGAFTGGAIAATGLTVSQRGVVYSIAPDPTLDEGSGTPDNPPPDDNDTTPPTVSTTNPANGATGVALNSDVTITWSESIDCDTVTTTTVTSNVIGWQKTSCTGSQAVFSTSSQTASTQYNITVTTGVSDLAGNNMSAAYAFSYTTAPPQIARTMQQAEQNDGNGGEQPAETTASARTVVSDPLPLGTLPAGTSSATLEVTTNESATCKFASSPGMPYDAMANKFSATGGTSHQQAIAVQEGNSYQYFVRCKDPVGNKNTSDTLISFSVAASGSGITALQRAGRYAGAIGDLLVGTAHAQAANENNNNNANATTNSGVFDLSTPEYSLEGFTKDGLGSGSYSSILDTLRPSTFYYVRAYAKTSDGNVYYGNQVGFKTADACFIATAAYGSLFHPCVSLLREFRDQYLQASLPGQLFVKFYYRHSPPVADFISTHPVLRPVVQVALLPAVGLGWLLLHLGTTGVLLLGGTASLVGWRVRRLSRKGPAGL